MTYFWAAVGTERVTAKPAEPKDRISGCRELCVGGPCERKGAFEFLSSGNPAVALHLTHSLVTPASCNSLPYRVNSDFTKLPKVAPSM